MSLYLVLWSDYDGGDALALFTTKERAEEYAAELREHSGEGSYYVKEMPVDAPRQQLGGAWMVRVNDDGSPMGSEYNYYSHSYSPSEPGSILSGGWSGAQAYGLTKRVAFRNARALLAKQAALPTPAGARGTEE